MAIIAIVISVFISTNQTVNMIDTAQAIQQAVEHDSGGLNE